MNENKPNSITHLTDDAPELDAAFFETANLYQGDNLIKRGRPCAAAPKQATTIRLDADILAAFKAG